MHHGKELLVDLNAIWETLRIGRWKLVLATLLGVALASYMAFVRMDPKYSATAVLALETQVQRIDGIQGVVSDMPLAGYSNELVLFTQLEVFNSRLLMGDVVRDLKLQNDPAFRRDSEKPGYLAYLFPKSTTLETQLDAQSSLNFAINKLLKSVEIKLVPNSFAFHIIAHSSDAKQAQDIANSVAHQYITAQLESKKTATSQATAWLTERVSDLKIDLENNETRLREFDAKTALLTEEDLQSREIKLKEMRARAVSMQAHHDQILNTIMVQSDDPAVQFKSTDPAVVTTAKLRGSSQLDRAKEQLANLNQAIFLAADEIHDQANDFQTLSQIRRETEASTNLYEFFLTRLKETSIQQGIQRADSRLLSRAELPLNASSPSKTLILLMGGILGLLCGAVLLFIRQGLRQNFQTSTELAQTFDIPVLGAIPRIPNRRGRSISDVIDSHQSSFAGDALRNLRTALMTSTDKTPQTIMICSALSGEFKSTYSRLLAQQIASLGQRVLLLESDLRRISFQSEFGAPDDGSLIDILHNNHPMDQVITRDEKTRYDTLPAKGGIENAADLLARSAFGEMMEKLRAQYDVIIIDTPPLLLFPDARIVASHCDQIVLSVRAEKSRRQDVHQALEILRMADANIAGLVLANFDPRKQFGNRLGRERFRYHQQRLRA
jgi:capsular exopolysaccharide synthesis family protein